MEASASVNFGPDFAYPPLVWTESINLPIPLYTEPIFFRDKESDAFVEAKEARRGKGGAGISPFAFINY